MASIHHQFVGLFVSYITDKQTNNIFTKCKDISLNFSKMFEPGECRQTPERQILASLLAGRLSPFKGQIIFAEDKMLTKM